MSTLTKDEAIEIGETEFEKAIQGDLALDLTLWAYGNELVRRAQYASQGTAVPSALA